MKPHQPNAILEANNGLHSSRALSTAQDILTNHDLRQPVLFHLVLTHKERKYSKEEKAAVIAAYQATIKALVRRLRNYGCRCEYFGAYEYQPLKGTHAHCFLLIETSKKPPFKIMNINDGEYLHKLTEKNKINRVHVAPPKNPMHGGELFARPVGPERLANCLEWIAYPFKLRSKDGVQRRETYFNSEFKANAAKRQAELAALVAPKTEKQPAPAQTEEAQQGTPAPQATEHPGINERNFSGVYFDHPTTNDGDDEMNNQLTKAGFNYLGAHYERCVDAGMSVTEIQAHLRANGIKRLLSQIEHELNEVFCFPGYAAAHPGSLPLSYAEADKELSKAKQSNRVVSAGTVKNAAGLPHPYPTVRL